MAVLSLALLCDGSSDLCLGDLIIWMMDTHYPDRTFRVVPALEAIPARETLEERLERTARLYQPDVIFCHRDSERMPLDERVHEVDQAAQRVGIPTIPLVPVRMLEAWLLFDESAIRAAADNANGQIVLNLPRVETADQLPDPKATLLACLAAASELSARRKRSFNVHRARSRITSFIEDYSPLRRLRAFSEFEQRFLDTVRDLP